MLRRRDRGGQPLRPSHGVQRRRSRLRRLRAGGEDRLRPPAVERSCRRSRRRSCRGTCRLQGGESTSRTDVQHGFSSGGQAVGHGADVAWNATGGKVVHFVYVHRSGFEVGAGLVLGVAAAATGIGAILEGATGTGLVLGGASVIAGSGATAFDLGPCVHNGNPTACAGLGLGATPILAGGTGTIGTGLVVGGYISETSLAAGLVNLPALTDGASGAWSPVTLPLLDRRSWLARVPQ